MTPGLSSVGSPLGTQLAGRPSRSIHLPTREHHSAESGRSAFGVIRRHFAKVRSCALFPRHSAEQTEPPLCSKTQQSAPQKIAVELNNDRLPPSLFSRVRQ